MEVTQVLASPDGDPFQGFEYFDAPESDSLVLQHLEQHIRQR